MDLSQFVNQTLNIPGVQFKIEDNQLNQYDRYTYHFTLSMVGEGDSRDPTISDRLQVPPNATPPPDAPQNAKPVRKIIIAQSGVTVGINIVDVEIEDSVSSNLRYKNNVTTQLRMTLTEPYSINLIDQMFLGSISLGVRNWRLAPLFLELEFKGYDAEGQLMTSKQFDVRRIWKILLVDMESTLTQVGTTYKITAVSQNTLGFLDHYYQIPITQRITLGGGAQANPSPQAQSQVPGQVLRIGNNTTIKSFFEQLGDNLTNYYFRERTNTSIAQPGQSPLAASIPFIIYKFEIAEEIGKQVINHSLFDDGRRMPFGSINQNGRELVVSRGISITSLLDDIISSTEPGDPLKPWFIIDNIKGIVLVPRVECVVRNVGYDSLNNDYVRELTFIVSAKQSTRPTPTREIGRNLQLGVGQVDPQLQRLKFIADSNLVKAYPYYYTGRNTEIVNLNIVFQNMHIIPLPLASTTPLLSPNAIRLQDIERLITGQQTQYQQNLQEIQRIDRDLARLGPPPARGGIVGFVQSIQDRQAALQRASLQQERQRRQREIQGFEDLLQQREVERARVLSQEAALSIFDADIEDRIRDRVPGLGIVLQNPGSEALRNDFLRADRQNQAELTRLRSREFVEDIIVQRLDPALYTYIADPRDIANTLSRAPISGGAQNTQSTRQFYTTVLAQIYDRSLNQLTEIEMEIRGDPYWLGKTNIEREQELVALFDYENAAQRAAQNFGIPPPAPPQGQVDRRYLGSVSRPDRANYFNYDAHLLLMFRAGQVPDEDTGFQNLEKSVYFTAVYQAITVTHKFSNGGFTQKINAVRDGLINLQGLRPRPSSA